MLSYILRRTAYSILVIVGVMLLTFVLFRFAAGDPAEILLGKNPSPFEVEQLRKDLSSDKPLLWGNWQKTEIFRSVRFNEKKEYSGIKTEGATEYGKGFLKIDGGKLSFTRNFELSDTRISANIAFRGTFSLHGRIYFSSTWENKFIELQHPGETLTLATDKTLELKHVEFYREYKTPWDSQLVASFREIMSFTDAFPFLSFLNFGKTLQTKEDIRHVLWRGMWPSLFLMLPIFFGELFLGVALALVSTAFRGKWLDRAIVILSVAGMSISYLVFIIFGQWYLGYYFNWFPVWGYGSAKYLALPVIIGVLSGLGGGVRFYRTVFVNELNREYLRTAEAKGCTPYSVYCKHLLGNAMIPIITRATTLLPFLFTGSLLLESFFGIPGLGYAGINALMNSDLQMIKSLVIVTAFIFVFVNLLSDIAYAWADPRVRLE
ncbi:MAG: ABC transporter permease [Lentisphaerota bacterium]